MVDADELFEACGDRALDGGITIRSTLEPLAGSGSPIKPAVYAGGEYQTDRRWIGEGDDRRSVDAVVIDNTPSQANRLEAALARFRSELGLPEIVLDLGGVPGLPPHLPPTLSSFRFPHRNADAYLRDSALDGVRVRDTTIGRAILAATADSPDALLQWFPQALLFGFWQSHLGKKRSQAKLARSWVSEIVGYEPATVATRTKGTKGDPLNLSITEPVEYNEQDLLDPWNIIEGEAKKGQGRKNRESLAEIGHGQVPFPANEQAPAGISFAYVEQRSTVSFASLRRIWAGSPEKNAAARALLASLGLVAHVAAFSGSFTLRSGCDLRQASTTWTWLGSGGDSVVAPLSLADATALFRATVERGEAAGLPVGSRWARDPLVLTPNDALAAAIRKTYPVEDGL